MTPRSRDVIQTIGQARSAAYDYLAPTWSRGTLAFNGTWFEDDTAFIFTCEPLEWLRDRDPRFMVLPGATVIVEKATGRIEPAVFFPGNELDLRLRTAVKHKDGRYAVLDADE